MSTAKLVAAAHAHVHATAAHLICAILAALVGLAHGGIVAVMFVVALALLMASLIELTREIRVQMATMVLD